MKQFKNFGIKSPEVAISGEKIKIEKILNRQIEVHGFQIKKSKFPEKGNGECLYLQLKINGDFRVLFSGSANLIKLIREVKEEDFPFCATIVKDSNDRYEFT